ncbi:MAG: hypothetical protein ACRD4V_07635 [Candidatus Acidiferrales bacterium]
MPGGGIAIVKHGAARYPRCSFCHGSQPAKLLCDFEMGKTLGGEPITCDAKVCVHCAKEVGPNLHHCPRHK